MWYQLVLNFEAWNQGLPSGHMSAISYRPSKVPVLYKTKVWFGMNQTDSN